MSPTAAQPSVGKTLGGVKRWHATALVIVIAPSPAVVTSISTSNLATPLSSPWDVVKVDVVDVVDLVALADVVKVVVVVEVVDAGAVEDAGE